MSNQYVDVMLDLETMGVGNNPALIQLAAVAFNSETGEEYVKFDRKIDLQSSMDAGLTITAGTIKFWMTHKSVSQETRDIVMEQTEDFGKQGDSIEEVLTSFKTWYKSLPTLTKKKLGCAWGNGAASDNVWVRSAYEAIGVKPPFIFRDDLCLRTLRTLAKRKGYSSYDLYFDGNMHDGLDDCRYQIKDLIEIKKFLNI